MDTMRSTLTIVGLMLSSLLFGQFGDPASSPVKVDVLSDVKQVKPGDTFRVGVRFKLEPKWHIYSKDSEDGVPTSVDWKLPKGVITKGGMSWPKAVKIETEVGPGPDIVSYGYEHEVVLVQKFALAPDAPAGPLELGVTASYGACGEGVCLPPNNVELTLPVDVGTETVADAEGTAALGVAAKPEPELPAAKPKARAAAKPKTSLTLLAALGAAFLGGLILNLMPCVLPVLSIKIMGLMNQAEEGEGAWKHGAAFGAGVLASFWTLAGLLLVLRAGSKSLGWGFQLQHPFFVFLLLTLMFVMALTFFGVFEVGMSLTTVGQGKQHSGLGGSFFSGILATLIATPCTAPFMGSALGFALVQPAAISLLVFTALGLGMALPYILLTSFPPLLKFVPKPGAWMESLKQFMGFPLMATVVWLLYVLNQQAGAVVVAMVLLCLIVIAIGGWVYGRWTGFDKSDKVRRVAQVLAVFLLVGGIAGAKYAIDNYAQAPGASSGKGGSLITWEHYTPAAVEEARNAGKAVFIDFTASWCLTCTANKVAFTEDVAKTFNEKGIAMFEADWTNRDSSITAALESYGRSGVPLYVLYHPGAEDPIFLPQLLTPGAILAELDKLP